MKSQEGEGQSSNINFTGKYRTICCPVLHVSRRTQISGQNCL